MAASTENEKKKKMLTLRSSDNEEFLVEESVAIQSVMIKNMVEDDCASSVIPLPNVTSDILVKVIEYLNKHADSAVSEDLKKNFDSDFVKEEMKVLFHLLLAANFLDIAELLDLISQKIADEIKDKSVEKVREIFNVTNDYTPEEYEKVRKENEWAFEGVED